MRKQERKSYKILDLIKEHIRKNIKEYFSVCIIFLVGVIIGVMFINNADEGQKAQITQYLGNFTESLNTDYQRRIASIRLLIADVFSNFAVSIW